MQISWKIIHEFKNNGGIGRNDEKEEGKIANQLRYVRAYHQTLLFYQELMVFFVGESLKLATE